VTSGRLEAFSDGVIAIVITIMVLELRTPEGESWRDLSSIRPVLLSYVLSFVHLGIYWSNHHHLFQAVEKVNGRVLWANLHLLFWLSLVPFTTRWLGESGALEAPVAAYGIVLALAAFAYYLVVLAILSLHGRESQIARAIGSDLKGKLSMSVYLVAVPAAFFEPWVSIVLYVLVAATWMIPDRRIEAKLSDEDDRESRHRN
jgi:uncharacterized membrane protein